MTIPNSPNSPNGGAQPDQSESGRPLIIPGGPLPILAPFSFTFKRLFTVNWHVYIGFSVLVTVLVLSGVSLYGVELQGQIDNSYFEPGDPSYKPIYETSVFLIAAFVVLLLTSYFGYVVLTHLALRDTRGVRPAWGNLFKNVPWVQGILALILVSLIPFALDRGFDLLENALDQGGSDLAGKILIVGRIGGFLLWPMLILIPMYAIDGRTNALGAFKAALKDATPHYLQILLVTLPISYLAYRTVFFTLTIGLPIFLPVACLVYVFIYRWVSAHRDAPHQYAPQYPQHPAPPYPQQQAPQYPQRPPYPGTPGGYVGHE